MKPMGAMMTDQQVADAPPSNWVDAKAPPAWRPYLRMMRADRPIGWRLLLTPGWQSIALAVAYYGPARISEEIGWLWIFWLAAAFLAGSIIMRGAGCILNDIIDRDIDGQVERTRSRPLPSGQVTVGSAAVLMVGLCLIGLLILASFPPIAIGVGLASALPCAIYTFMKRITWWPQLFLGIAFSWGALLGWTAVLGDLGWPAVALYVGGIAWTIGYDTIYAHQDREDDALVGVKSTARLFGARTKLALTLFYGIAVIAAGTAGAMAGLGWLFWAGLAAYAAHLGGQILRLDIDDDALCLHLFKSNWEAGLILLGAIILGAF